MAKILYVEDDSALAVSVEEWLTQDGHIVELAGSGEDAVQLLTNFNYDLILLDWDLPAMPGIEVCKKYRDSGGAAWIIFLTGKLATSDLEIGLEMGADDYVKKPFEMRELSGRIRSALRRTSSNFQTSLSVKDVHLDVSRKTLTAHGAKLSLTARETALLEFLMRNTDKHFSAKALLASVWPSDTEVSESTVRSFMRILRQKLESLSPNDLIKTDLGSGYIVESK